MGIDVNPFRPAQAEAFLRTKQLDLVLFEHFDTIRRKFVDLLDLRFWQPSARIVVDTVDVEFHRLLSKSRITQRGEDYQKALETKTEELSFYSLADLVLAISDEDRKILLNSGDSLNVEVIPLIHQVPVLRETARSFNHTHFFLSLI